MAGKRITRHRRILAELELKPSLRVSELADRLAVSQETVRRDLDAMTAEGLVDRTYGGAMRRRSLEPSVNERHNMRVTEREAIARAGCEFLAGSTHLMIGSGATTVHLARRIATSMNKLTVICHSFGVATVLSLNPTITVIIAPGIYHSGEGAVHGAATLRYLEGFRVDWAILGASGLTGDGPTDALIEAAEVYQTMVERAERTLLLADSSKFDQVFPAKWAEWSDIAALVTDAAPAPPLATAIAEAGAEVVIAH
ncbi:DeoR/GlpR transcriptional regulator [Rhodobacteraceae bacterium NNCM2]|nr:DeoR/GlpR transcriptional regulator [Coraliihabitans acroporae]